MEYSKGLILLGGSGSKILKNNYAAAANSCINPLNKGVNCKFAIINTIANIKPIVLIANKNIKVGQELWTIYGAKHWKYHDKTKNCRTYGPFKDERN